MLVSKQFPVTQTAALIIECKYFQYSWVFKKKCNVTLFQIHCNAYFCLDMPVVILKDWGKVETLRKVETFTKLIFCLHTLSNLIEGKV